MKSLRLGRFLFGDRGRFLFGVCWVRGKEAVFSRENQSSDLGRFGRGTGEKQRGEQRRENREIF